VSAEGATETDSGGPPTVTARRKTMTFVGFRKAGEASRIYVRTDEPVRYRISEADRVVVLELENTRIGIPNNQRFLDTSFFDTAVAMVRPEESETKSVRVEIQLKQSVPYQTQQKGNELYVEFERPNP
jgi:colicin import membrane protein